MPSKNKLNHVMNFAPLITGEEHLNRIPFKEEYKIIDSNTYVGIEVEVEQIHNVRSLLAIDVDGEGNQAYLWRNVEDGSLRNNGREFVSLPVRGSNISKALHALHSHLTKDKGCIGHEFTDRTSVHVHVNVRDLTCEQITNILLVYLAVEPIIYNFCGGKRHKNIFCVPLNQSNLDKHIHAVFEEASPTRLVELMHSWKKYTGFNMKPVRSQGTVEFRHMVGTIDIERLTTWINLLLCIKLFAANNSFDSLKSTILNLNTTSEYMMFIRQVFGGFTDIIMIDDLQEKMEDMVIFIKDCFSSVHASTLITEFNTAGGYSDLEVANKTKLFKHSLASNLLRSAPSGTRKKPTARKASDRFFDPRINDFIAARENNGRVIRPARREEMEWWQEPAQVIQDVENEEDF